MLKTEIALFVKRARIELEVQAKHLDMLVTMADDDLIEDCLNTGMDILDEMKRASNRYEFLCGHAWQELYNVEQKKKEAENDESVSA